MKLDRPGPRRVQQHIYVVIYAWKAYTVLTATHSAITSQKLGLFHTIFKNRLN